MPGAFHLGGLSLATASAATFSLGGRPTTSGAMLTPTQALVQSFQGTGLVDALLVFDPAHYSTPGSTPGVLVDALGGPITYTAPNTQATPSVVQDASGYTYASADGVDDTLIASANQKVSWYCAVFRSPPGHTTWSGYGAVIDNKVAGGARLGNFSPAADAANGTGYDSNGTPRSVSRDGVALVIPYSLAPITTWQVVSVSTHTPSQSLALQLCAIYGSAYVQLHLAALAIRYTDPTAAQQSQIEQRLTPMQQALLASA